MDVTEHRTGEGKLYLAAVVDAWSRRVVGWSIADHIRAELVADALQMATWRRRPPVGQTIAHSDHGSVYTSWLFGNRLRHAGILGSMGTIGDAYDNSVAEAFFSSLQRELLDQRDWVTRDQLAGAIFEWIEAWYNPRRRHSYCNGLSPIDYETANAALIPTPTPSVRTGELHHRCPRPNVGHPTPSSHDRARNGGRCRIAERAGERCRCRSVSARARSASRTRRSC
jgi:transposase InsO family protein